MKEIKIISVEKKARSKKYNVITSEEDYTISEDMLIKYHIFKDSVFTKKEFDKILQDLIQDEYFNKVLNLLSFSLKSEYEIIQYIHENERKSKKYLKEKQLNDLIGRLKSLRYLDDEILCNHTLDYYYRNKKGPLFIKQKLIEKKVDKSLIDKTLDKYSYDMEKELIEEIISKEYNNNLTVKKFKLSLSNKLIRNGFSNSLVYNLVDKMEVEDLSLDLIEKDYNKLLSKVDKKDKTDYEKKQLIINGLLQKGYEYQVIANYLKNIE